ISSHRLDEVSSLVNRVVEMDTGRVVLDDRVADDVTLTDVLDCRIVLKRFEPAFAKALEGWPIVALENCGQLRWQGKIAGPDRLRFLGIVSRYTALVSELSLNEVRDV
ncbi:MAG: ABC transporter ATP-binding protein, partial [Rhodocyclales bacterium]|nr:ABC transporter ATP-binding protein [Rhodocyclales bacterium]